MENSKLSAKEYLENHRMGMYLKEDGGSFLKQQSDGQIMYVEDAKKYAELLVKEELEFLEDKDAHKYLESVVDKSSHKFLYFSEGHTALYIQELNHKKEIERLKTKFKEQIISEFDEAVHFEFEDCQAGVQRRIIERFKDNLEYILGE